MGTRADIIANLSTPEGEKWGRIYCHWDGYPQAPGVGSILAEHYADPEKIAALIELGDISSLGASVEKPEGHSFDNPTKGYTVAYGRDRGEKHVEPRYFETLDEAFPGADTWTEYTYVFDGQMWWVGIPENGKAGLYPLAKILSGEENFDAPVKVPFVGVIGARNTSPTG